MSRNGKIALFIFLIIFTLIGKDGFALEMRSGRIKIPENYNLKVDSGMALPILGRPGEFRIYFFKRKTEPVKLAITDIFGVTKVFEITDPSTLQDLEFRTAISAQQTANPTTMDVLPKLCPRIDLKKHEAQFKAIYRGDEDFLNHKPSLHLAEKDVRYAPGQSQLLESFDSKNSLKLVRVRIKYDYEDSGIIDYTGPNPITDEPGHIVHEGDGGFYANFHYAIVPFEPRYLNLSRQELLNLAQGKLKDTDRVDLLPKRRVHSLLPGPYLSKNIGYAMCEWGDTAYQAKTQEVSYRNITLWDWDVTVDDKPVTKLLLIIWEGDEEEWMVNSQLIDPFYLTDDVVGTFIVERKVTKKSLVLRNNAKDFEIEVVTEP